MSHLALAVADCKPFAAQGAPPADVDFRNLDSCGTNTVLNLDLLQLVELLHL